MPVQVGGVFQRNLLTLHTESAAVLQAAAEADDAAPPGSTAKAKAVATAEQAVSLLECVEDVAAAVVASRQLLALSEFKSLAQQRLAELHEHS